MHKDRVSVACKVHNMKWHTVWVTKDEVSVACEAHNGMTYRLRSENGKRRGQCRMQMSQYRITHWLRAESAQKRGQCCMQDNTMKWHTVWFTKIKKDDQCCMQSSEYEIAHKLTAPKWTKKLVPCEAHGPALRTGWGEYGRRQGQPCMQCSQSGITHILQRQK